MSESDLKNPKGFSGLQKFSVFVVVFIFLLGGLVLAGEQEVGRARTESVKWMQEHQYWLPDADPNLKLIELRPSLTHGFWIRFETPPLVEGHDVIWYSRPEGACKLDWGRIGVEKETMQNYSRNYRPPSPQHP